MISITSRKRPARRAAFGLLSAAFWLCVWQRAAVRAGQEILVAPPAAVLRRLWELSGRADFWLTVLFSMGRVVEGFALGVVLGTAAAVLTEAVPFFDALFRPILGIIKATPVASFIILALVWMKSARVPVFVSVLIVLPLVWANVSEGIRKTDRGLLEMARLYRFGAARTVRLVYAPSVLPYFLAAGTTGMGMAWKGGVAAEVLSSLPLSLGGEIYRSKIYLETADLFAWTAVVVVLSVLLERAMVRLLRTADRRIVRARGGEHGG